MQQFTFALAHDLKNSLTKLKLALSLVADEEMPPVISNYFQIINRSAERLENIMVSLNKIIQLGDTSPDVVKVISPATVFAEVQEEFAEALNQKNAEIRIDFSELTQLNYIEVYLKSIFTNLVSNAIKYSSSHRPLRLCISARRNETVVRYALKVNQITAPGFISCSGIMNFPPDSYIYLTKLLKNQQWPALCSLKELNRSSLNPF